ncbi:MAG: GntR family transcriptional regulator [Alphaproteobacteria bacterium]|nr:GntR family transcriptional regulator [Alphaproteobacteria bacterium]
MAVADLPDNKGERTAEAHPPSHGPSSPDQVVAALIKGVRAGRYVPGQRLIEADLTRELRVSRGPVREALKRLAAEGLVSLIPHRGAYIRALTRAEVHDMLLVQEALAGLGARLAAAVINEADHRAEFENAYGRLQTFRQRDDAIAFIEERSRFYATMIRIGGNAELRRMMPALHIHLLRMQFHAHLTPKDRERQFEEYDALVAAILAGEQNDAEKLMRQHIRRTRLAIERLPDEAFAAEP